MKVINSVYTIFWSWNFKTKPTIEEYYALDNGYYIYAIHYKNEVWIDNKKLPKDYFISRPICSYDSIDDVKKIIKNVILNRITLQQEILICLNRHLKEYV